MAYTPPTSREEYTMDNRSTTRLLLICGVIGPLLFMIVALVEGATRPGYVAWRDFISELSLSDQGWEQIANFIVSGLLFIAFAVGLRQALRTGKGATAGPILLMMFGLFLILSGIFVTDSSTGYPSGAPTGQLAANTLHGKLHGISGLLAFTCLAAACFVMARRFAGNPNWKGWTALSVICGLLIVVGFTLSLAAGLLGWPLAGLFQRLAVIAGWGWVALLAWRLLNKAESSASS
ncbi:MAG: DUF998 domain-containing protein [Candidatus Chloroheliales bacterium]|nr:MAG: DUF998 domain-containing protein [Chloroflexota bacterium]